VVPFLGFLVEKMLVSFDIHSLYYILDHLFRSVASHLAGVTISLFFSARRLLGRLAFQPALDLGA
jgi:hypothetical protein